eukprot:CAMPEP_0194142192 /NCGR_PEP_ID=MMETSP0152-20130528/11520_1 /TAXON_ID=1049557 /ORGANISM="Thalassiothrix antarctica, Strain L6-D1" /LENGTH=299 /DNA_ID=CAMNT_0038841081 /DNA_START=29 /DNA_END=928 /DNA_ORIENTATION=+
MYDNCNPQSIQLWDEAVALYTGSLETTNNNGGILPYHLANKRCEQFNTCERSTVLEGRERKLSINDEIFQLFHEGQTTIGKSACDPLIEYKERIVHLMTVPLIQSTLYYAHIRQYRKFKDENERQKASAEGALYAASILPLIHFCYEFDGDTRSQEDSHILYQNMKATSTTTDFKAVKMAIERNYYCLRISCDDIGGLYDPLTKEYSTHDWPCVDPFKKDIGDMETTLVTILGLISFLTVVTCCFLPCRRRRLLKRGEDIPPVEDDNQIMLHAESDDDDDSYSDDDMEVLAIDNNRSIL